MSHHQDRALSSNSIDDDDPSAKSCRIWSPVGVHSTMVAAGAVTPNTLSTAATPFDTSTTTTTAAIPRQNLFNSPELVVLNVGGHTFTTSRSTLFSVPGSFLEAMFSGRHAYCALQTADGAYFIDRDGSHFRHILNFLRTGSVVTLPSSEVEKQELALEADFYGLEALVKAIRRPKIDISEHLSEELLSQREKESELRTSFCTGQAARGLLDPNQGLIAIFCPDDGIVPLKYDPDSPARNKDFLFLDDAYKKRTLATDDPRPLVCVESIESFRTNFNREWPNILHRIDQIFLQEPVIIAGGSVLRALTASNNIRTGGDLWGSKTSDIDVFLYARDPEEANRICKRIFDALAVDNETWVVIRSRGVVNMHRFRDDTMETKVQIVLRLYDSPTEVLVGFDVDCCLCAYDGRNVWLAPRCVSALVSGTNVLNPLHAWPNRASYELRLAKYASRGFAVSVPGIDRRRIDYSSIQKSRLADLKGLARFIKITSEMDSAAPWKRRDWHQGEVTTIERPRTVREIRNLREVEVKTITDDEWLVDGRFNSPYDDLVNVVVPSVFDSGDGTCFSWLNGDFETSATTREEAWPDILDAGEDGPAGVPRRLVDSWDIGKRSREYLNGKMDKFDLDNLYYSHAYGEHETTSDEG